MSAEKFRRGIVAVLQNAQGELLLCERSDHPGAWQFPQGGIEAGESPEDAFHRELLEEIGNGECRILRRSAEAIRYRWPQMGRDGISGQEQTWFLGEFISGGPDLEKSDHCFRAWQWSPAASVLDLIVDWKRASFAQGLRALELVEAAAPTRRPL